MVQRSVIAAALLSGAIPLSAYASAACNPASDSFAAAATCNAARGSFAVAILRGSIVNAAGSMSSGGTNPRPGNGISGVMRVSRIVEEQCTGGCQATLPNVPIRLRGEFSIAPTVNDPPGGPQDNVYMGALYRGEGAEYLEFDDLVFTHGESVPQTQVRTGTLTLVPGDYSFSLTIAGNLHLNGTGPGRVAAVHSSLALFAELNGASTWEVPCTPIPEPETYALMLAGLAAVVVRRRTAAS